MEWPIYGHLSAKKRRRHPDSALILFGFALPEISLLDRLVGEKLRSGALHREPSGLEDIRLVGGLERHVRVLLVEEHGYSAAVYLADYPEYALNDERRESERRLVHHDQLRLRHKRAPDREHLLLAARERSGKLPLALLKSREQPVYSREVRAQIVASQIRSDLEVFLDGQVRENVTPLGDKHDARLDYLIRRFSGDVLAVVEYTSGLRSDDSGDGLQYRRFARAVRADQRDDLPLRDGKGDALDRLDAAVGHLEVVYL